MVEFKILKFIKRFYKRLQKILLDRYENLKTTMKLVVAKGVKLLTLFWERFQKWYWIKHDKLTVKANKRYPKMDWLWEMPHWPLMVIWAIMIVVAIVFFFWQFVQLCMFLIHSYHESVEEKDTLNESISDDVNDDDEYGAIKIIVSLLVLTAVVWGLRWVILNSN